MKSFRHILGLALGLMVAVFAVDYAAAAVTAKIYDRIQFTQSVTNDVGTPTFVSNRPVNSIDFTTGTGDYQVQVVWADTRTISASSSENLDVAGALTDAFGATVTCATVKAVQIEADAGNTNNVLVGGAASNTLLGIFGDATDIVSVKPGGKFMWVAPKTGATVTAATGDILKVANSSSGTTVTYTVTILCT